MIPKELKCVICERIFCCVKCRKNHEKITHNLLFDCSICRGCPFVIDPKKEDNMQNELIEHIVQNHLPLHCIKCNKMYNKADDIQVRDLGVCAGKNEKSCSLHQTAKKNSSDETYSFLKRKNKLKHVMKTPVMTSTPTNPTAGKWQVFQKSLTSSTLSGIHSPDSDIVQSPPIDEHKVTSTNQISSIESPQEDKECKSNVESISEHHRSEVCDSSSPPVNSDSENISSKKKRVTFADEIEEHPKVPSAFAFIKPKRVPTPISIKPMKGRTPRFQAIINNFEANQLKQNFCTPIQERPIKEPEETPPTTEPLSIATGRMIDFKQDESPTFENEDRTPPMQISNTEIERRHTPATTPDNTFRSCIQSPSDSEVDFTANIAQTLKDSLVKALMSAESGTTEINLKIIVSKRTVSLKETKVYVDKTKTPERKTNESNTLWSRFCDGIRWVFWKENIADHENHSPTTPLPSSASKRKRCDSLLHESPISNKRYRFAGRINGRRPLDRILKDGVVLPGRSYSTEGIFRRLTLPKASEFEDENNSPMNKSF